MTTEIVSGPACDLCDQSTAVLSLMNYADYSQIRACTNCAPHFMRSVADSVDGRSTAEPEPEPEPITVEHDPPASGSDGDGGSESGQDADAEGSAADHWASTKTVVRSTHGHRSGGTRARTAKPGEPE